MTKAATTTSSKRAEANRRNARKSTGPRTPEGKDRSKFNAIKHGLNAKTLVLPGEDAGAFQDRLDAWAIELQPRNDVEQILVERSATLSWQLERADRADAARLASIFIAAPAEEALRQTDRAAALGQRLFRDSMGPLPLYPHSLFDSHGKSRVSDSGLGDDPDAPSRLILQLESNAAGCRWLLDRWGELGGLLDRGLSWQSPDKLKAIRLLGRQPLDAADSEVVALIFQACHVLDPQPGHASGVEQNQAQSLAEATRALDIMGKDAFSLTPDRRDELGFDPEEEMDFGDLAELDAGQDIDDDELSEAGESEAPVDLKARIAWQQCGAAFAELRGELTDPEAREYRRRLEGRRVDELRPRNPAEARAKLRELVDQAAARLEARREVHEQWAAVVEANQVARLSFDDSPEGERLRRFQLAGNRSLLRTLETLRKFRRDGDGPQSDLAETDGSGSPAGGEHTGEPSPPAQPNDPADTVSRLAPILDPVGTADRSAPVESPEAPSPNSDQAVSRPLEPTPNPARSQEGGSADEPAILPGIEPRRQAATVDRAISRNEPTTDPVRDFPTEIEATLADDRKNSRNEPTITGARGPSSGKTSTRERIDALGDIGSRRPGPRQASGPGPPSQQPSRPASSSKRSRGDGWGPSPV